MMNIERIPTQNFDNLGQHAIAGYLETKNFCAKVYSGVASDCKSIITKAVQEDAVPVLGFYTATDNLPVVLHVIQWIKSAFDVFVFVGGPQAVMLKEDFLRESRCDAVIEGEGEIPVYQLLSCLIDNLFPIDEVQSLRWIDENGKYRENPLAKPFCQLDEIPCPTKKRVLDGKYRDQISFGILTGRGCPYHCAFCYEGAHTKNVRLRSIENVMKEIQLALTENPRLVYLNVYDDTFTLYPQRVYEFCEQIKKYNLLWYCEGHVTNLIKHPEMVKRMVESGLIGLQIGIESGSDSVLKAYNKNTSREMLMEVVRICRSAGLTRLVGNFIVGGAYETEETVYESMSLAEQMLTEGRGMFDCKNVFLAPYPHTPITLNPEKYDLEYQEEFEKTCVYSMYLPLMKVKAIPRERLIALKLEFDKRIQKKLDELSAFPTVGEVFRNFYWKNRMLNASSAWKDRYSKLEHIVHFLEGTLSIQGKRYEQYSPENLDELYPVRTFMLLDDRNEELHYKNITFTGAERALLTYAAGKLTFRQIAQITHFPLMDLKKSYYQLFEYCFIYASEF